MDDAALVEAARSGDDTAWAAIYDRYADKLHDHCYRILRDRDEAADALHDAFLAGSRNLEQLRDPTRLRPWLYSICRHTSLRRLKAQRRVELTDAPDEMTGPDPELERGVQAEELSEVLWAAAAGLNGRDQALLDLHLRHGLEGQELADAMGTSLDNSYVMLSRLRDQVERALGALLIARLGRDDCEELGGILAGWDGTFSPLIRKRVARHVDGCETCSEKRKTVASPLALLGLAPLMPAPAALKARVISSIRNVDVVDAPHVPFNKEGFAALGPAGAARRLKGAWLAVAAPVLLVLGGIFLLDQIGGDDGTPQEVAAGGSTLPLRDRELASTSTAEGDEDGGIDDETSGTDDDGEPGGPGGTTDTTSSSTTGSNPSTSSSRPGPSTTVPINDGFGPTIRNLTVVRSSCRQDGTRAVVLGVTVTDPSGVRSVAFTGPYGGGLNNPVAFRAAMSSAGGNTWQIDTHIPASTSASSFSAVIRAFDMSGRTPGGDREPENDVKSEDNLSFSVDPCATDDSSPDVIN